MKPLVALDLGSTHVACVIGRPALSGSGYDVLGAGVAPYARPTGTWPCDPALLADAIERALDEAQAAQAADRAIVALAHPELLHARVAAHITLSDEPVTVRSRDVRRLSAQAISQALPLDREVLLLEPLGYHGNGFAQVPDPRGLTATKLGATFLLISMPLAVRRAVIQALDVAGLELQQLVYSPHALYAGLSAHPETARLLLVDLGGACTDLAVFDHGRLMRTATLPWGGLTVMDALAKRCRLTREQALAASVEGLSSAKPGVRQAIESQLPPLKQGLAAILRNEEAPEKALVTGRGALMDGLAEWIEATTGVRAVLGRSLRAKRHGELHRQVALSAAFGLLEMPQPRRLLHKGLIGRTRHLLLDYF